MTNANQEQLSELISEKLGFAVNLTAEICEYKTGGQKYIKVSSGNLAKFAGVMSNIYDTLYIINFGGAEHTEYPGQFWCPINFAFTYVKGGSNGAEICTAWFENGNWIIK
jgi:hypothetical protein